MSAGALKLNLTMVCWLWAMAVMEKRTTGLSRTGKQQCNSIMLVYASVYALSAAGERGGDRKVMS